MKSSLIIKMLLKRTALILLSISVLFHGFIIWMGLGMSGAFVDNFVPESIIIPILVPIFIIQNALILFKNSISKKMAIWVSLLPVACIASTFYWNALEDIFLYLLVGSILYIVMIIVYFKTQPTIS